jgi:anti-anti-sigma factor
VVLHSQCPSAGVDAADLVTVVHFAGGQASLDEFTVGCIREQLYSLVEGQDGAHLLVDFGNVSFAGSEALGVMVGLHKRLLAKGRRLMLRDLRPLIHELFLVTRLDRLIDLQPVLPLPYQRSSPGVLIADDDAVVRNVLEASLRKRGFTVRLADDGRLALQLYKQHHETIDVVLLDVRMPGLNGPETLVAIKGHFPAVRACFMTKGDGPQGDAGLLRLGARRVFRMPLALDDVVRTVAQLAHRSFRHGNDVWIQLPGQGG